MLRAALKYRWCFRQQAASPFCAFMHEAFCGKGLNENYKQPEVRRPLTDLDRSLVPISLAPMVYAYYYSFASLFAGQNEYSAAFSRQHTTNVLRRSR